MEILKDKKILVGGLAVIGGIALVAYLLKPKHKMNTDGFYSANGRASNPLDTQYIPNNFTIKGGFPYGCAMYQRTITPNGFIYSKRHYTYPNQIGIDTYPVTEQEFMNQLKGIGSCG
jgi:hypothetical protein